jgi:hypothetical protein
VLSKEGRKTQRLQLTGTSNRGSSPFPAKILVLLIIASRELRASLSRKRAWDLGDHAVPEHRPRLKQARTLRPDSTLEPLLPTGDRPQARSRPMTRAQARAITAQDTHSPVDQR